MFDADISSLVNHDIYARNLLLGESLFVGLRLPPAWSLAPGVSRPEVAAAHERRNRRWVASGDAWYVVFDGERRWTLELAIRVRVPGGTALDTDSAVRAGGHPAQVVWRDRRRGLPWRRHTVKFMTVTFDCPSSERRIKLEFSGWCPIDGFQEVLAALEHIRCH